MLYFQAYENSGAWIAPRTINIEAKGHGVLRFNGLLLNVTATATTSLTAERRATIRLERRTVDM